MQCNRIKTTIREFVLRALTWNFVLLLVLSLVGLAGARFNISRLLENPGETTSFFVAIWFTSSAMAFFFARLHLGAYDANPMYGGYDFCGCQNGTPIPFFSPWWWNPRGEDTPLRMLMFLVMLPFSLPHLVVATTFAAIR